MDRNEFIREFETTTAVYDVEKENQIINDCIDTNLNDGNPRGHRNLIIVMEELGEMIQAVSKEIRDKGDYYNTVEEMADTALCLRYMMNIFHISPDEVQRAMQVKLNKTNKILMEEGHYQ